MESSNLSGVTVVFCHVVEVARNSFPTIAAIIRTNLDFIRKGLHVRYNYSLKTKTFK